jgi:polysaccharide chain length determinant protein (PEP-CTERM system associated)
MDQLLEELFERLRGIWLWRFWGLSVAWLVAIVGLAAAIFIPSKYEATARVFVDTQSVLKPLMAGLAVQPDVEQQVAILSSTLMSRPNVEKLIRLADLDRDAKTERDRNALIDRVAQAVQLRGSQVKGSGDNLFWLSYRDTNPARAKRAVESLLSIFVDSGLSGKRRDTNKAMVFLDAQIKDYEEILGQAEQRLKQFKLQNLEQLASGQDAVGNMLALDGEIQKARTEFRAAAQRRDALGRQLAGEDPVVVSDRGERAGASPIGVDPVADIDSRADGLRRNLDELLRKYTDEHPDVVGTRRILADLEKQREALLEESKRAGPGPAGSSLGTGRREPNLVYQQLKVAFAEAEGNVAALGAKLSDLESRYDRMRATARLRPEFEEELAQLNREYLVQKTNYEQLVQRREQAKLTGELDESGSVDFSVIDPPRVSSTPVAPNRLLLVAAALVLSLGAGVGFSFILHRAFPTVSTLKGLHAVTQTPALGFVSYRPTPAILRSKRRSNYAFAGGATGLCSLFAVTLIVLLVGERMG